MYSLREIVRRNNSTFYHFGNKTRQNIWPRVTLYALISASVAVLSDGGWTDFLDGIITVQAILIGASFSVLFFLLSNNQPRITAQTSIEDGLRKEKLHLVTRELFYNISYFNIIAIASTVFALLLLIPPLDIKWLISVLWPSQIDIPALATGVLVPAWKVGRAIVAALLLFALIESMYTFIRTVRRVSYYFNAKLNEGLGKGS
jgi:hypothetical protein